ncbi:MAG TPA: glutamyl-tRNA reductase [Candidatus Limnocylindria bacterium]|nr:glutamyl-tRNA reductase [Candidatus Limnocylindria bacterium]
MEASIVLIGLSHHTAPVELRERVAVPNGRLDGTLRELVRLPGVSEAAIVSTCNRVEVIACGPDGEALERMLPVFLAERHGVAVDDVTSRLYVHRDREAVRHLFRVAASLDSMVVGEPQILGQLKEQYARAVAVGSSGPVLHRCFHKSFSVAKRVRTGTRLAERAVSVGTAAIGLAKEIFDRLDDKTALLLGAGTMGELTARQLLAHGIGSLMVTSRTFERALTVARTLHGTAIPFDRLLRHLAFADLVVSALDVSEPALRGAHIEAALRERRGRPVFLIDLAVPRSLDPAINEVDGAYLYDIDDLQQVVAENRDARAWEARRAEAMIEGEVETFWAWLRGRAVAPTIADLRAHAERLRARELERHAGLLAALDPQQREELERLTRRLVNKILHAPTAALGRHGESEGLDSPLVHAARELFALDEPPEDGGDDST